MNSYNIVTNAYKGLLYHMFLDLKRTVFIGVVISLSLMVFDFVMTIIFVNINEISSNDGGGTLFSGVIVMMIALIIHTIKSKDDMNGKFAFPINRTIYGVSNLLFLIVASFILLATVSIVAPVEIIIFTLADLVCDKLVYINPVTLKSFTTGFIASWAYLVAFASITYCLSMYLKKYLYYTLPVLTIIITCIIMFGWFGDIIRFLFLENNVSYLVLKLLLITLVSHTLGFIPLKRMEVY